ncbi:hypothetical protein GOP47_0007871 [Adiantum capillus-veneris]|uniref:Receptor-like serine/threonine-protein kinase n=1 Tax=Adiantum capillus-veneris TaxID=13818 RepID=A0A9D4V2F2_ADICA|nr:hypothetical protein GOP47_0007871 [Adiantum capillus-veneris]
MAMVLIKLPSCSSLLLLLCISMLSSMQLIRGDDKMELNSVLTPSSAPLQSPSSAFVLSFRPPPASADSSSNLYLAISFAFDAAAQAGPPAWVANRDNAVSSTAKLTLLSNGDLSLSDPSVSPSELWSSRTSNLGVVQLRLLDSGNLVLLNNKSDYVWQSFFYPTDTLLPTQNFTIESTMLKSNERSSFFESGSYTLGFNYSTGVLQLSSSLQPAGYWMDWGNITSFSFDLVGSNITMNSSPPFIIQGSSSTYRLTLDVDGNLRMHAWDAASAEWKILWMSFTDVCDRVHGLCGEYGVCLYNPQPTCVCPQGFNVKDLTLLSSGCERVYEINPDCSTPIKYAEIENVDFPSGDFRDLTNVSIKECKDQCLQVCSCMAAVYWESEEYGHCWLKEEVRNGKYVGSQKHKVFLKMSNHDPSVFSPIKDTATNWSSQSLFQPPILLNNTSTVTCIRTRYKAFPVITLIVLVGAQALCFAVACMALLKARKKLKYLRINEDLESVSRSPLAFSYQEVEAATENFTHKLGAGGFGTVYKGKLPDGTLVAVKKLEGVSQQEKQFRAEIATLGHIHHINLLRLVGFCSEGTHRLLVYEFMENGSLDQILFQAGSNGAKIDALDWGTRFQICLGVARGIHYLHEECLDCILHCDIKPQNILLDGSFIAKVADFGLAYLYSRDHTVKMTTIRGTRGYLAPEWVLNLPITAKADVFSYGMLVMEIVSGRKNYLYTKSAMEEGNDDWYFPVWAYGKKMKEVIDSRMDAVSVDYQQVELVLKVAFACAQGDRNARPSMGRVVQMLEGTLPVPEAPPPSLFPHGQPVDTHEYTFSSSDTCSKNTRPFVYKANS